MNCYNDWADQFMNRAIDQVSGRIVEPITLSEENAWSKKYRYNFREGGGYDMIYFWYNSVSKRRINITRDEFHNQSQPPL